MNKSVNDRHSLNVFMPIVDSLVDGIVKIRCLIDTGSTSSFITQKMVSDLQMPCAPVILNLTTMNKSICKQSNVVDFTIESMNQAFEIDMKSIFVIDSIPGKPYMFDVDAYPYMNGIDGHIDLLIGQDYAECVQPLHLIKGNIHDPYAVKTPLGYVIHGPNTGHIANHSVVSNLLSASEIENDIHKLWELDQSDILPRDDTISLEDKHVLSFWERNTKTVDGKWHIPIPWKK